VVSRSHRFGVPIQQEVALRGATRKAVTEADVETWARERDALASVEVLDASDGDVVLFDGRLWHGSRNRRHFRQRTALILQFATPDTPIRIPDFASGPWPLVFRSSPRPACILVHGSTTSMNNRIQPGPVPVGRKHAALGSRVRHLSLPLPRDVDRGIKAHHVFRGATSNIRTLGCHVSVLEPGRQPHDPHRHDEEELLILLDGEAELMLDAGAGSGVHPHRARPGTVAYYPAGYSHTIRNPSAIPVTYLMFKWKATTSTDATPLGHGLFHLPEDDRAEPVERAMRQVRLLRGETRELRELRVHVTRLEPGEGYEPHIDAHDVGIVVLDGTVETLGEAVGRHGVILYRAGEPHGMRNVGPGVATYIVVEFHGRTVGIAGIDWRAQWKRLARVVREPARLRRAVASRVGW